MIRLQEPELKPYEDHSAWQASWNDNERLLAHCPPGYWYDFVLIAMIKRILQGNLEPEMRLRFLEQLHKRVHGNLSIEAMQRVEPACDTAMKMLGETDSLELEEKFRLMLRWNVIAVFVNLNPSILEAINLMARPHSKAAVAA
jgi:hypothetical protein